VLVSWAGETAKDVVLEGEAPGEVRNAPSYEFLTRESRPRSERLLFTFSVRTSVASVRSISPQEAS
jgi:hypothetical protein